VQLPKGMVALLARVAEGETTEGDARLLRPVLLVCWQMAKASFSDGEGWRALSRLRQVVAAWGREG